MRIPRNSPHFPGLLQSPSKESHSKWSGASGTAEAELDQRLAGRFLPRSTVGHLPKLHIVSIGFLEKKNNLKLRMNRTTATGVIVGLILQFMRMWLTLRLWQWESHDVQISVALCYSPQLPGSHMCPSKNNFRAGHPIFSACLWSWTAEHPT